MSKNILVKPLNSDRYKEWDNFVDKSRFGTLFHTSYWNTIYSSKIKIIVALQDDKIVGGVCLNVSSSEVSHPILTPYNAPLAYSNKSNNSSKITEERKILNYIINYLKNDLDYILFNTHPDQKDILPFIWKKFKNNFKCTYQIEKSPNIVDNFSQRIRRNLRKSESSEHSFHINKNVGRCVKILSIASLPQFSEDIRKIKILKLVENSLSKGYGKLFSIENRENIVLASALIVYDSKRAYYILGGHSREIKDNSALTACLYKSMSHFFVNTDIGILILKVLCCLI